MSDYQSQRWKRVLAIFTFWGVLFLLFFEDSRIHDIIQSLRMSPWLEMMEWVSFLSKGVFLFLGSLLVLILGLLTHKSREQEAGRYGIYALALSGLLVQVLKHLIGRSRPRMADAGVLHPGFSFASGYDSFPSGHATSAFALAFILARVYPRGKVIFYGFALLVAFSRLYVNAHFASDVFAGAGLGMVSGMAISHWGNALAMKKDQARGFSKPTSALRQGDEG